MEHNASSLAARRKFMGDFSLLSKNGGNKQQLMLSADSLLSTNGGTIRAASDCRRHPRPSSLFPAHILPYLYLGNDETAKNLGVLKRCGIRYVINVTSNLPNYFEQDPDVRYLRIPVDDSSSHNLFQFFPKAISFIEKARGERASVLVHCWAGISRSVTVCLAYLMYALHNTLEEAFDLLLKQNGAIAPNFHFLETLTCWERQLFEADAASHNRDARSSTCGSNVSSSAVSTASSEVSPVAKQFNPDEVIVAVEGGGDSDSGCCSSSAIDDAFSSCCSGGAGGGGCCMIGGGGCECLGHADGTNLHIPCHKTSSSPTIRMNLPMLTDAAPAGGQNCGSEAAPAANDDVRKSKMPRLAADADAEESAEEKTPTNDDVGGGDAEEFAEAFGGSSRRTSLTALMAEDSL